MTWRMGLEGQIPLLPWLLMKDSSKETLSCVLGFLFGLGGGTFLQSSLHPWAVKTQTKKSYQPIHLKTTHSWAPNILKKFFSASIKPLRIAFKGKKKTSVIYSHSTATKPTTLLWVRCRSTNKALSNILSQICENICGICMFLGHVYSSGAVCEYSIWVTHCGASLILWWCSIAVWIYSDVVQWGLYSIQSYKICWTVLLLSSSAPNSVTTNICVDDEFIVQMGFSLNGLDDNCRVDADCVKKPSNCRFYTFNNSDSRWPGHMYLPVTVWLTTIMRCMHACEHTHAAHAHSEREIRTTIYAFYTQRSHKVCSVSPVKIQPCVGVRSSAMKSISLVLWNSVGRNQRPPVDGVIVIVQTFLARRLHPTMMLILTSTSF